MKFETLRDDYARLYATMEVRPERKVAIDKAATRIIAHREQYEDVQKSTGVPWYVVGIIHHLESGGDWATHLHNGDPLSARTVQKPRGRPSAGKPPFSWEVSACDALNYDELDAVEEWSLPRMAYSFEKYNGFGSRNRGVRSAYLWSFTYHHDRGKYIEDGKWSATEVSAQAGAMPILRRIDELCTDVDLNIIEPDPAREFVRNQPERAPPSSMATSSEGNTAVAVGGVSTTGMAMEVSAASAKVAAAKTPTFMDLLWALLSSPTFLVCAFTTAGAAYLWMRRAARLKSEGM